MRYLKLFEDIEQLRVGKVNDLLDFSQDRLVYLLDNDFTVTVNPITESYVQLELMKQSDYDTDDYFIPVREEDFMWDDIKDYFVPFLQMLSKSYKLGVATSTHFKEVFFMSNSYNKYFYYSDIVSGEVESELQSMVLQKIAIGVNL